MPHVHCNELHMFWAEASPLLINECSASDIPAEGTTFSVFSYDAVIAENRNHHLPNAERMRYVFHHSCGL